MFIFIMNKKFYKKIRIFFLAILISLFFELPCVHAHKVYIFAWVEGNTIYTESKFSSGKPTKNANIMVVDDSGKNLLSGKTNEKGEFSFKIPKKTNLNILVEAGMGHKNKWIIKASEIGIDVKTHSHASLRIDEETHGRASLMNKNEIQIIVEKALDNKLRPIIKMLLESTEQKPTFKDIFGGIGYILGLLGIAAYIYYRKQK
ncbi:nickel transport protein [Candidatus Magnetomoraceae bacterium gMMP-1]